MANSGNTSALFYSVPDTDLNRFFGSGNRDSKSGLPLRPCSLLLRYLLPEQEIERYVLHRRVPLESMEHMINSRSDGRHVVIHITGSSVEGLSVPPYRERTQLGAPDEVPGRARTLFYQASDVDSMSEVRFLPVEVRPSSGQLYVDEQCASHVGYVRVVLDQPNDTYGLSFPVRDICKGVEENDKVVYYLSNNEFTKRLEKLAKDSCGHADHEVSASGPAITLEPKNSGQRGLDLVPDIDIVTALPLLGHPPSFCQWLERVSQRDLYWPSHETVDDIRLHGRCFVVTTGHASSEDRDLECRLSFSDPEKRLAQTMTPAQRKVYLLVKLLQKCYLKVPKVLVTYHLKTLMFWILEASEAGQWTEYMVFEQVLRFLDKIIECLEQQNIPSYFYPKNNLISHATPEHVAVTLATVRRLRENPLHYLYGVDERVWMGFSTLVPLPSLYRPALNAIGDDSEDFRMKMANGLMQHAKRGTMRDILWPLRCADLMRDTFGLLQDVTSTQLGDEARTTEGSAVWSASDWLVLAALAVFAAVQQEEVSWVQKVARYELLRENMSSKGNDSFVEATDTLLPGRPHAAFLIKMFLAAESGNYSPLDPCATLKYYLMVEKEKREFLSNQASKRLTHQSVLQSSAAKEQRAAFGAGQEREPCANVCGSSAMHSSNCHEALNETESPSTSPTQRANLGGARPKDQRALTPEEPPPSSPDLPSLITRVVMPRAELQNSAAAAASPPGTPSSPVSPTMDRMAGNLQFRETYGWCPQLIVELHVVILNIIGYLLRRQPRLACRCAFWVHQLTTNFGGWGPEVAPNVPLSAAPLFLDVLPPSSAALLRRPCAKAALLPLSAMLVFATVTRIDERFRQQLKQVQVTDETLARFFDVELKNNTDGCGSCDDVEWTSVVLKLCLREMLGQDVQDCLREIGAVGGSDKGKMARQILTRYDL